MDAIVLGAGIAGLTASYRLKRKGRSVLLLEKGSHYGGCLKSVRHNGFLFEKGPNSFLNSHKTILEHVGLLGLQNQIVEGKDSAKNRFIWSRGRLNPVPKKPLEFLRSPLMTIGGKIRLLMEPCISARPPKEEETVAQFVTRRLGKQALNLVEPMIHGIYAGDAKTLSLSAIAPEISKWEKEYGSLFKALKKARLFSAGQSLCSFKGGMQTMADALYKTNEKNCRFDCQDIQIEKSGKGWKVKWIREGKAHEEETPLLVLAVPAYAAAALLEKSSPGAAKTLQTIPYAPLAVLHLVVDRSKIPHPLDGFGFLSGGGEKHFLLGCLWSSSIFDGRCRDRASAVFTCFAGGAKNQTVLNDSDDVIIAKTIKELGLVFGETLKPSETFVTRLSKALPQYTLGHGKKLEEIRGHVKALKGLCLVGNYWNGISVNDTMCNAAEQMEQY